MPIMTRRSGCSAWSVAAPIATSGGVRSWSASTPVPRSSAGASCPAAARRPNASRPVVSAVQKDRNPSSPARRAAVSDCSGPRVMMLAAVTPMGTWEVMDAP